MPYADPIKRREYRRAYYVARRKEKSAYDRAQRFGVTSERFAEMIADHGGRCAICGTDDPDPARGRSWCIDHDHRCCPGRQTCGECVRGLLCGRCNHALGIFKDDPEILLSALTYLQRYPTPQNPHKGRQLALVEE